MLNDSLAELASLEGGPGTEFELVQVVPLEDSGGQPSRVQSEIVFFN